VGGGGSLPAQLSPLGATNISVITEISFYSTDPTELVPRNPLI